jgi:hypothetical protein
MKEGRKEEKKERKEREREREREREAGQGVNLFRISCGQGAGCPPSIVLRTMNSLYT